MKIRKLIVPEYKNVKVDLNLNADLVTLLVGQNGMGKSNLLEILLQIFDELNQLAAGRKPTEEEKIKFDYTLEYECRGKNYRAKKEGDVHYFWEQKIVGNESTYVQYLNMRDMVLPNQIVGYYSGENKRVKTLVSKHIKREESSKRRRYSKGKEGASEPKKLFFAENRHSMLVLTTLLLYQDHPQYGDNIKKVLRDVVQIDSWDRIHLRFRNPGFAHMGNLRKEEKTLEDYLGRLTQGEDVENTDIFWGVKGNVDKLLRLLLYYALDYGQKFSVFSAKRGSREFFDVESIPSGGDFKELLYDRFSTPLDFLNTLEECYVLNMIEEYDVRLRKLDEKIFYPYLHLSEGEQQYLTVMGLIALAHSKQDETLFLLDEPDTHINPQWQRSYIKHILDLSETEAEKRSKAFFISTHSPLLVQANSQGSPFVDLLLFKKGENGKIQIDTKDDAVNNWRIDQVLMSKYFDLPSSRPVSLDDFMKRRSAVIDGQEKNLAPDNLSGFTDEFGYLPTGETMADVEAMVYIHQIAEELRKKGGRL